MAANITELREMLERHGLSYDSFAALRPDSYEHALARCSVDMLDQFYALALSPGVTLQQIQSQAPKWPGGLRDGSTPAISTLGEIVKRLRAETALNGLGVVSQFVEQLRSKLEAAPGANTQPVVEAVCTLIGQELIERRLSGVSMADSVKAVKVLLQREDQKIDERKLKILEAKATQADQAKEVATSNMTPEQKQEKMRSIFGLA